MKRKKPVDMKAVRSGVLFCVGLAGLGAETIYSLRYHQTPDSTLLLLFAAMLGVPVFLNKDTRGDEDDDEPPKRRRPLKRGDDQDSIDSNTPRD